MSQSIFLKDSKLLQTLFLDETSASLNKSFAELFLQIWSNGQQTYEIILHDLERKEVMNSPKNFRVFKTASMALRFWQKVVDYWLSFEPFHLNEQRFVIYFDKAHLYSPNNHELVRFEIIPERLKIATDKDVPPSPYGLLYDEMVAWLPFFHLNSDVVEVNKY